MKQVTRVRFPAETCLSRGVLIEDGDDLGQVSYNSPNNSTEAEDDQRV